MTFRFYEPGLLSKYPHMYGTDKILIDHFWEENDIKFNKVIYDCPVGGFFKYVYATDKRINADWEYLNSFKIDMLGFTNEITFICEFKHHSKPEGIGQLLTYQYLLHKYKMVVKPTQMLFITYEMKPDLIEVCHSYNIDVIIVDPPVQTDIFDEMNKQSRQALYNFHKNTR